MDPYRLHRLVFPVGLAILGGCTGAGPFGDGNGEPSVSDLRQVATATLSGKGFVDVSLVDGVVYLSGDVENAIDENAVIRRLGRIDGVTRVESLLRREM